MLRGKSFFLRVYLRVYVLVSRSCKRENGLWSVSGNSSLKGWKRGVKIAPSLSRERKGSFWNYEMNCVWHVFCQVKPVPTRGEGKRSWFIVFERFQPSTFPVEKLLLDGRRLYLSLSVKILFIQRKIVEFA